MVWYGVSQIVQLIYGLYSFWRYRVISYEIWEWHLSSPPKQFKLLILRKYFINQPRLMRGFFILSMPYTSIR